jgi:AraC-like DNA-binding protein
MVTDVLSDVIGALHIRTTLFAMADLSKPWGVRFPAGAGAYFHTVSGEPCWLRVAGNEEPIQLHSGEIALLAHGAAHRVTSSRRGAALVEFDPTTWLANTLIDSAPAPTAATGPSTTLVCGAVDVLTPDAQPLLGLLPPLLVFGADDAVATGLSLTLALLRHETDQARPGTQTMLTRLGDMLLVQLVRLWLAQPDAAVHGWLPALQDPQLNAALQAMHADPAAPWTVDALATHARLSRSRFAERFTTTTGIAPLTYLTRWRLTLAAGMLRDGRLVNQVSRAVGYTSEPAFSRAFHRHHGQPPSRLRP